MPDLYERPLPPGQEAPATIFLRLLAEDDKAAGLSSACARLRQGETDPRCFEVAPEAFDAVPGKPFAYWVNDAVRNAFKRLPAFESGSRTARQGLATAEDFRFVRNWWETESNNWSPFAKGGVFSPFYSDIHLAVNWQNEGAEIKAGICRRYPYLNGNAEFVAKNTQFYFRPGLTWPNATTLGISVRVLPTGCVFGHMGPSGFVEGDDRERLFALIALANSKPFSMLIEMQLALAAEGRKHYEVGVIQKTPVPILTVKQSAKLAAGARRVWALKRSIDTATETSHAFFLPATLRTRLDYIALLAIQSEQARIQAEIDAIAFDLYGFSAADRRVVEGGSAYDGNSADADEEDDDAVEATIETCSNDALLSWAVGVAFGRFDWRLATGERESPLEPDPFDPLPAKSPGMLPDGAEPFHLHPGILVDDKGRWCINSPLARSNGGIPTREAVR